jgi:MYXO-CTERM domain-containing protein
MALPVLATSRRRRGLAAAACAAVALPTMLAGPALAQTSGTNGSGATQAAAIRITVNLPQGQQAQLVLDPVSGTTRSVVSGTPEAQAFASLLAGTIVGRAQDLGRAEASLTGERQASGPTAPANDGFAGSPLAEFLSVKLLDSGAEVTEAPNSSSSATITSLGVGLPQALVDGLAPALTPIREGVTTLLLELADGTEGGIDQLCAGAAPAGQITQPVVDALQPVPGVGTIAEDLLGGVDEGQIPVLCTLDQLLRDLDAELQASLDTLVGPGGILGTGLVEAEQTITTEGGKVTSRSAASIADLTVLGQSPFAEARALQTTSVAAADGTTADATVDAVAVELVADPVARLFTDLDTLTGQIADLPLDGVGELVTELQALFDALLGIGIDAGRLGSPTDKIEACPTTLTGDLSGTFEAGDGSCAAAAARGYGLAITLPAAIAGPAGINGPLVEIAISPSAAVANARGVVAPPPTPDDPLLPRTGGELPVAAAGLALLVGAALLRRRRGALAE